MCRDFRTHTHSHTHKHTHKHTHTHTHTHIHTHTQTQTHTYNYIHTRARTHAHTRSHTHTCRQANTRTHTYIHSHTLTHMHIHTDTQTRAPPRTHTKNMIAISRCSAGLTIKIQFEEEGLRLDLKVQNGGLCLTKKEDQTSRSLLQDMETLVGYTFLIGKNKCTHSDTTYSVEKKKTTTLKCFDQQQTHKYSQIDGQ